jgi:hypothetical protein
MHVGPSRAIASLALALALTGGGATAAAARASGDDDVRVRGTCSGSSVIRLRLRAEDGRIRAEVELSAVRNGAAWSVVVLHERRLVARVTVRAQAGDDTARVRRLLPDWYGTDTVSVRASRAAGETCRASATL